MSLLIIWIPLFVSFVVLIVVTAALRTKNSKLNRQLDRTNRYRANFENRTVSPQITESTGRIPTMGDALLQRGDFLKKRTKKRADKQRRLVSRLNSRS